MRNKKFLKMKTMKNHFLYFLLTLMTISSCRKSDGPLDVDLSKYNADTYAADPVIDKWLTDSLNMPYNIQTVYRFERNLTSVERNISPIELERVLPTMRAVRNIFLKPYEKVAGAAFIKKLTPKQFVLYGSPSYNDNGSITLGTADGGRRVVLYELNNINLTNGEAVRRVMRTIHHEFTHIITQNIDIPPSFEQISKADYTTDWTGSANTPALAKELGFISQYSRSSFEEDFAEMIAHLLVEGQPWFNNYINTTNAKARAALLAKEKDVIDYFQTFFNINFKDLQAEVQKSLKEIYSVQDPADVTKTNLALMMATNRVSHITFDPTDSTYLKYGNSQKFINEYFNYTDALAEGGWNVQRIRFIFKNDSIMTFRVELKQGTGTTVYAGDYDLKFTMNSLTGLTQFTKFFPEGTGTTYNIGRLASLKSAFDLVMLPYLTTNRFVAAWLPNTIPSNSPLYRQFAGFYVDGDASNYFYGPIVLK